MNTDHRATFMGTFPSAHIFFPPFEEKGAGRICFFFSPEACSQMVGKLHSPSLCDVPQQVGYRFFFLVFFFLSPLLPLLWEEGEERMEERVTVWSEQPESCSN